MSHAVTWLATLRKQVEYRSYYLDTDEIPGFLQ